MLKEIIEKRKKYKQELKQEPDVIKKARSNAFKLLANAAYGYQGFFGARYYCEEAAAATAVIVSLKGGMSDYFMADHPFMFIIQQKATGNILFMGRVVDPGK